jgi:hypothetical protein
MNRAQAVSKQELRGGLANVIPFRTKQAEKLYLVPPVEMLIEGFLPRKMIVGLTSYPGTGKTFLAMEAARAVATGSAFLGKFEVGTGDGRVLMVLADASEADYGRQWARMTKEAYWQGSSEGLDRVEYLAHPGFRFEDPESVRKLLATNERCAKDREVGVVSEGASLDGHDPSAAGFDLIIFDTLSKLTAMDQNSNNDMEVVFTHIRYIAEITGATILLLHHNSKGNEYNRGSDWRGAMSQIGALDCWFQLDKKGIGQERVLAAKKFRGLTPAPIRFTLDVGNPDYARLTAETADEMVAREKQEAGAAKALETMTKSAVARLKSIQPFKRGQADTVLVETLPGWANRKKRSLEQAVPRWLTNNGFSGEGEGSARTYRFTGSK